jgi:hypothetical protein
MKRHDGDITPRTNSYYGDDTMAELEAAEIVQKLKADAITAQEKRLLEWTCEKHGCAGRVVLEAFRLGVMGSAIMCQIHLEEYHKKPLTEILEAKRKSDDVIHHCARCGRIGRWISEAGEALCSRHEDDY